MHDLELVALAQAGAPIGALRHDLEVALDRDLACVEPELVEQRGDRERAVEAVDLAVDTELHAG